MQAKERIKHFFPVAEQICIFVLSGEARLAQPNNSNELQLGNLTTQHCPHLEPAGTGHTGLQIIHVKPEKYVFSSSGS